MSEKIIVHWLEHSRSHRVIWLLEELQLPYEVKVYKRTKGYRAPKELDEVHPLGKSPVVEIISPDGEKKVLAESGHIFSYFLQHYDKTNRLGGNLEKVDYFLHYTEGTLQGLHVALLVNDIAEHRAPWGTRFLVRSVLGQINSQFYVPEVLKNLSYLESILAKQADLNSQYFVGSSLTAADIILSFPIFSFYNSPDANKRMFGTDFELSHRYPHLVKWYKNVEKEKSFIKANETLTNLGAKL